MITSFCSKNIDHLKFKEDLKRDVLVEEFVSTDIERDLRDNSDQQEIELKNSYIIQDKDKLVGYIYIERIPEEEKVVELRCAIHPKYRRLGYAGYSDENRKGYGQQILEEFGNYLFTFYDINAIELHIRKDNYASINCAEKAKCKRLGENNIEYYYIYRKFKGDSHEN